MNELRCNIELKARVADLAPLRRVADELGARCHGVLHQIDTYFPCAEGRLKLRETDGQPAQLIWYARANDTSARSSHYRLVPVADADGLKAALTAAFGVRQVVDKRRELWLLDNVRIHLDDVSGLGCFFELEAVLTDRSPAAGHEQVAHLRRAFGIAESDLVAVSYGEL